MYDNDKEFVLHRQQIANQEKLKGRFVQMLTKTIMQYITISRVKKRTKHLITIIDYIVVI